MTSILQDWVTELPLREQGTMLTCIRGCDLTPKYPLRATERMLVAHLRWLVLRAADPREVGTPGGFLEPLLPGEDAVGGTGLAPVEWSASELGHYPVHWYAHLMHGYEVIAYRHPIAGVRARALAVYERLVDGLHLRPEPPMAMIARLSEDRIASGKVVS